MPLLKPDVSRILDEALKAGKGEARSKDTKELLEEAGLGLTDTLLSMKNTRDFTESESIRTSINRDILKMHGVMREEGSSVPVINIIIADPNAPAVDPILLPRELHASYKESIN